MNGTPFSFMSSPIFFTPAPVFFHLTDFTKESIASAVDLDNWRTPIGLEVWGFATIDAVAAAAIAAATVGLP